MTTDAFTEAARIIDAHRENERWVGDGVKIECVCGHTSHASGAVTHYPITEAKNNHRDAERMHAAHVAQVLAAQEPTDAECTAILNAVTTPLGEEPKDGEWFPAAIQRCREVMMSARAARRYEENRNG